MSADLTVPAAPATWITPGEAAAWRAGWLAGYDAAMADAESILQRASDAEDTEAAK